MHKTASTWLQRHVFPHMRGITSTWGDPVLLALTRELAFHQTWRPQVMATAIDDLETRHGRLLISSEDFAGDHWDNNDGATNRNRLAELLPDAQVVAFVRRQPQMIWSLFNLYVMAGGTLPFRRWVRETFEPDRLHFGRLLDGYVHQYGPGRVHVVPYEALTSHRAQVVDDLCKFMGATVGSWEDVPVNPSLSRAGLATVRLWTKTTGAHPRPVRETVRALDRKVRTRGGPNARQVHVLEELGSRYRDSNRLLQSLTRYDLAAFGYDGVP